MTGKLFFPIEVDDGEDRIFECGFEFLPGRKGKLYGPPEDCYPDDPSEVYILYVCDEHGNELLDKEWPIDEDELIERICKHMEDDYED